MNDKTFPTPSQFYRHRRPEYFSDSKIVAKAVLPREQLDYEISQISINQKHDNFENLCRRLAEKLIAPNLIPQVGPTGGGDGKTDTETYPVSNFIAERWFISDNKWNENENWAFAISAKKDWKPKVKSDIKNIVETKRGYTKIFFFSSQKISSRNKKETQDQLKAEYEIEVIILDAEWIIEKVYDNRLLNEVIETLNLSRIYLEEKSVGPNDEERLANLSILEEKINSAERNADFKLVEECLESAILSRMLELPKAEVIGKFERAKRFANKIKNNQLKTRIHYQLAWTLINWYDHYEDFYEEYKIVKQLVVLEPNLNSIELLYNLNNILRTISAIETVEQEVIIDFEKEEKDFMSFLTKCSSNPNKLSTALLSKFYLSFITIFDRLKNDECVSDELIKLKEYSQTSRKHIDIPFDQLKETIEIFGNMLPASVEYDNLIDLLAEIEAVRVSELSSGQTYLKRGITKLENNYNKESLVYFGKAARKLAKEETQNEFYFCLMLLSDAYSKLNLYWASYNALVSAANIYANIWFTTGSLHPRFVKCIEEILKNELIIGRIPVILCWYELFNVIKAYSQQSNVDSDEKLPTEALIDACLVVRLLNTPFQLFERSTSLPDILYNNQLWLSQDAVLYMLGHTDAIELDESKTSLTQDKLTEYFQMYSEQPFVDQIAYETNLLDESEISLGTRILGINFCISTSQNVSLLLLGETILAYLESFMATSFKDAFPLSEKIKIKISHGNIDNFFNLVNENNTFDLVINESHSYSGEDIADLMNTIIPETMGKNFLFANYESFFENLYKNDEVHERLSIILNHSDFLTNILTNNPKIFLNDWKSDQIKKYNILRSSSPLIKNENLQQTKNDNKPEKLDLNKITHKNLKAETVINSHLWDKAKWKAFGFVSMPEIPFGIFLSFENADAAKEIFENWIKEYGRIDKNEIISLVIIKGINKEFPSWYKILVSKRIDKERMQGDNLVSISSRFHRMEPDNNTNLTKIIEAYEEFKRFILIPAHIDENFSIRPYFNLGIMKTELKIVNAWEIGVHDIERMAITADDNPIIPNNITNAPIVQVLEQKTEDS